MEAFVFFRSGMGGGTGSFAIRLSRKLAENNKEIYYVYSEINDKNNYDNLKKLGVKFLQPAQINNTFFSGDSITILAYTIEEYCEAAHLFKRHKRKVILLYPVMNGITGNHFSNHKSLSRICYRFTKPYLEHLFINDCILFTEDQLKNKYSSFYGFKNHKVFAYFPLPITTEKLAEDDIRRRFNSSPRVVVTFFRTDFPLKGYVFGLIDDMKKLWAEGKDIKLLTIATGEKLDLVKEALGDSLKEGKAQLIEGCDYEGLKDFIRGSFLNIGHGTSVLDATSLGVPSFVSCDLTYSNLHGGFLHEKRTVTSHDKDANYQYYDSIKQLLEYDYDEYRDISIKEYNYTKSEFSMDSFYETLTELISKLKNKKIRYDSNTFYLTYKFTFLLQKVFTREGKGK